MVRARENDELVLDARLVERGVHGLGLRDRNTLVRPARNYQGGWIARVDEVNRRDGCAETVVEIDGAGFGAAAQKRVQVGRREIGDDRADAIAGPLQWIFRCRIAVIGHQAGDQREMPTGAGAPHAYASGIGAIVSCVQLDVTQAEADVCDRIRHLKARRG